MAAVVAAVAVLVVVVVGARGTVAAALGAMEGAATAESTALEALVLELASSATADACAALIPLVSA